MQTQVLEAARSGDEAAFRNLVDPLRNGLMAHCYRMSGSIQDAEDLVQETTLRAWRNLPTFEERSSFRNWMYRIATHATLDALARAKVRTLPAAFGPSTKAGEPIAGPRTEAMWLEPYPDALLPGEVPSAEAVLSQRESIRLAFVQALQKLPANQRAALLLKDVVGLSSAEIGTLLETTPAAVNSRLQRARETLGRSSPPQMADTTEQETVARYVDAFETSNVDALVSLLREDAVLSMPPVPSWFDGAQAIAAFFRQTVLTPGSAGRFVGKPTRANGAPAIALYARLPDGSLVLSGVHVLTFDTTTIVEVVAFMDPASLKLFA